MATIRMTDLLLRTVIGIHDWERKCKQDVIINVALDFDASVAAQSDDVNDTIDYKALKLAIMDLVESSRYNLLEKLAGEILTLIMKDERITQARVRIDKPGALRFAKSVSVELTDIK